MGNNVAAGHVLAATGLPQAVGFHKTLGQMMYQYNITPWDPKVLLQTSLQRQMELQKTSPLRFIQVEDGLRFYGAQLGGVISVLSRERFVEMSMTLFKQKGLHLPVEEARLFYDIFDSIDLYQNAQLSIGELAGGLSSFFGGTNEAKTNAVFDLLAAGRDQIPMSTLQEFLKPYVWCMVPPNAEVLRPVLLPHVAQEIYNDMSYGQSGYITRQELQRWAQKGQFSQGQIQPQHASMSFTIIDRAALAISIALRVAWHEYEQKYALREYGQQTWQEKYPNRPQHLQDVGVTRYAQQQYQQAPAVPVPTASSVQVTGQSVWQSASVVGNQILAGGQVAVDNVTTWFAASPRSPRGSIDGSLVGTSTRRLSDFGTTTITQPLPSPQNALRRQTSGGIVVQQPLPAPAAQPPAQVVETQPVLAALPQAAQTSAASAPNLFAGIGNLPTRAAVPQAPPAASYPFQTLGAQPQSPRSALRAQGAASPGVAFQMQRPAMGQPMPTMAQPMTSYAVRR